jgi:hypothetical protein
MTSIGAFQPASLPRVLEGTAERPYVYRILVPVLSRLFSPLVPESLVELVANAPGASRLTFERLSGGIYRREATLVMLMMFGALVAFVFAEKILLKDLGFSAREQFNRSLAILLLVLPVNSFTGYYYDFPQLLLVTISLILLHRRSWTYYLLFLAIANLNKETSVFLVAVFVVYYWSRLPRREFFALLAWQVVICTSIRGIIMYRFHENSGAPIFFTLPDQISRYKNNPIGIVITLAYFLPAIYFISRQWHQKNEFLRSASVLGAIILGLFCLSGFPLEFRVFLDALTVLGILLFPPSNNLKVMDMTNHKA